MALGPSADNPGWTPRPRRWPEPLSVPRIVACVDGSDTSEQVLPMAGAWARALGMSLTILTVADDAPKPITRERRYGDGDAERYIEALVEQWSSSITDVDGEVVRDPIGPASGLRVHLDQRPAGLVAVTTQARSGMQRACSALPRRASSTPRWRRASVPRCRSSTPPRSPSLSSAPHVRGQLPT